MTLTKEGYKIEFPGKTTSNVSERNRNGVKLQLHMVTYEPVEGIEDENTLYMIIYSDFPDTAQIQQLGYDVWQKNYYKFFIDGLIKSMKGTLVSESDCIFKNLHGRTVTYFLNDETNLVTLKIFTKKSRAYIVIVQSIAGKENNKSLDRFFNSFDLI